MLHFIYESTVSGDDWRFPADTPKKAGEQAAKQHGPGILYVKVLQIMGDGSVKFAPTPKPTTTKGRHRSEESYLV
jgi:hypothetical protein